MDRGKIVSYYDSFDISSVSSIFVAMDKLIAAFRDSEFAELAKKVEAVDLSLAEEVDDLLLKQVNVSIIRAGNIDELYMYMPLPGDYLRASLARWVSSLARHGLQLSQEVPADWHSLAEVTMTDLFNKSTADVMLEVNMSNELPIGQQAYKVSIADRLAGYFYYPEDYKGESPIAQALTDYIELLTMGNYTVLGSAIDDTYGCMNIQVGDSQFNIICELY